MKITIEVEDERTDISNKELMTMLKGQDLANVIWDLDNFMRAQIKYNNELSKDVLAGIEMVRDKLSDTLSDNNVVLSEFIF